MRFVAAGLAVGALLPLTYFADDAGETQEVLIVGVRDNRTSTGATGLALDLKDTPQSISVVTSDMMESFGANNLNDALRLATGGAGGAGGAGRAGGGARGGGGGGT